jgi:hypothetical protein
VRRLPSIEPKGRVILQRGWCPAMDQSRSFVSSGGAKVRVIRIEPREASSKSYEIMLLLDDQTSS